MLSLKLKFERDCAGGGRVNDKVGFACPGAIAEVTPVEIAVAGFYRYGRVDACQAVCEGVGFGPSDISIIKELAGE